MKKISSAVTVSDFKKLFIQTFNLSSHTPGNRTCISSEKNSYNNPLTCHIEKGKVLSNRKPVTSTARRNTNQQHQLNRNCKGKARYNITTKVVGGGNECSNDETENLEWYIALASRCYNEGFQWHMNYLNDCTRRSNLLKKRRLTGAISKSNHRIAQRSQTVEYQSVTDDEIAQTATSDDRFRDDVSDCKIRININQSANSNTNRTNNHNHNNNISNSNTRKRSNYSYVAQHLSKKINIMNSIDAINDMKTDRLNEVLDNFGSLNISCGSVLPQIVLTDFSTIDSMPRTNTLLLTPSAEQFNISGTSLLQSHITECLSIPAEYYRNETRPC